jgi:hypothetical protein
VKRVEGARRNHHHRRGNQEIYWNFELRRLGKMLMEEECCKKKFQLGSIPSLTGPVWRPLTTVLDADVGTAQKA